MAIPFKLPSDEQTIEHYKQIHKLLNDVLAIVRSICNNAENGNNEEPENHHPLPPIAALPDIIASALSTPSGSAFSTPRCSVFNTPNNSAPNSPTNFQRDAPSASSAFPAFAANDTNPYRAFAPDRFVAGQRKRARPRHRPKLSKRKKSSEDTPCKCCMQDKGRFGPLQPIPANQQPQPKKHPKGEKIIEEEEAFVPAPDATCFFVGEQLRRIAAYINEARAPGGKNRPKVKASGLFALLSPGFLGRSVIGAVLLVLGWKLLKQC